MASIVRFVKNWRVELVLAVMVMSLGTTMRAQEQEFKAAAADWCSDEPVLTYVEAANLCMGGASDCYLCIVWVR